MTLVKESVVPRFQPAFYMLPLAVALAGCGDGTGPAFVASELALARARWDARGPSAYEMTLFRGCECLPEWSGPVVLLVRDGAVESRVYTRTGEPVDSGYAHLFPRVEGLFDYISNAAEQGAAKVEVTYHPSLGFPLSIYVDRHPRYVDDEINYVLSDFQPR